MRLQLIAALLMAASAASAEPGARATLRVYADDDGMTVVSPAAGVEVAAGATAIEADVVADVVSGASVDVITAASPRPVEERRLELGLRVGRPLPGLGGVSVSALVRGSHEHDHDSIVGGGAVRVELAQRRLAVDARYVGGHETIGSVTDPSFARTRRSHQAALGVNLVADRRTVIDVVADARSSSGYHASPYRRVPWVDPAWPVPGWLAEQVPGHRRSLAGRVSVRRALDDRWFAGAGYGAYRDDWAITSHTANLDVRRQMSERVLAAVALRGYLQGAASFYRAVYGGEVPDLRTRDRILGPMRTLFASVTADLAVGREPDRHVVVAAGVLATWFPEFPLQTRRDALMVTLSWSRPLQATE
jgi:hypothetical protein